MFDNSQSPEQARLLTNQNITIDRESLPKLTNDEVYWCDLITFNIYNKDHKHLGEITGFFETAANELMIVKKPSGEEIYIPFLERFIISINHDQKILTMDWKD